MRQRQVRCDAAGGDAGTRSDTALKFRTKAGGAASTREGEEELLLAALRNVAIPGLLTVIVPRHPQRFEQVATLIENAGFKMQRRSTNQPIEPTTDILLGDTMGEMFAWYTACDVAFIGGNLVPLGGQNLIEACAVGAPVLIGPHTFNFAKAATAAVAWAPRGG